MEAIRRSFQYVFEEIEPGDQCAEARSAADRWRALRPVGTRVHADSGPGHGAAPIYGFRFGAAAYLTDHSEIPESSYGLLQGLDVLFLDALRYKPHPTHSTVERSIKTVERLAPRRGLLHLTSLTTWATNARNRCCRQTSVWPTTGFEIEVA